MITALIFAAASFLTSPVEEIVLRSGQIIPVEELVRIERGRLVFVTSGGTLYSLRLSDLDVEKTDARLPANQRESSGTLEGEVSNETEAGLRKLPVSEEEKARILAEMETRSHTGRQSVPVITVRDEPPAAAKTETQSADEEWKWRENARQYREAIERAKERLAAARQREKELNDMLLFFAGGTGDATNYSYLVVQLGDLRSMIPQLESEVRRAESAWTAFQEDARQRGILPGWLR